MITRKYPGVFSISSTSLKAMCFALIFFIQQIYLQIIETHEDGLGTQPLAIAHFVNLVASNNI